MTREQQKQHAYLIVVEGRLTIYQPQKSEGINRYGQLETQGISKQFLKDKENVC